MGDMAVKMVEGIMPLIEIMDQNQWGFSLFDAGSWAYSSVTTSTLAPIIFVHRLHAQIPTDKVIGKAGDEDIHFPDASTLWVSMIAVSTLIAGIICPLLGAVVDRYHMRKMTTYVTSFASVLLLTCFAYTTHETNWVEILVLLGFAMMLMSVSHCFYNSLLLLVTEPGNIVKVACLQSAVGGFAAALLLTWLGIADEASAELEREYVLSCFLWAALWFIIAAIPMWFWLKEESPSKDDKKTVWDTLMDSWVDTLATMKNSEMMKYLLAMILFNDASSTLHSVYLVYAAQLGIDTHVLLLGSVMSRWLAGVTSLAWLGMSVYLSPKAIMVLAIALTAVAIAFTAWMENEVHFFCVVFFISLSHSGSYIFSRVLLASITPQQRAAHNFGFMGMINRVAGFFGPFIFTAVSLLIDTRAGFLTLVLLAILGIVVMSTVDFEKGRKFWEYEEQGERKRGHRRRVISDVGAAHDDAESGLGR